MKYPAKTSLTYPLHFNSVSRQAVFHVHFRVLFPAGKGRRKRKFHGGLPD
jgi:hypothetical protein